MNARKQNFVVQGLHVSVLALSVLYPVASYAQTEGAPAPGTESAAQQNGDIVVTAQRQSQNIQKVPISITAITPQAVENLNINTLDKIDAVTPGLTFNNGYSHPQAFIRGIGTLTASSGLEPPTVLYIDGEYIPRSSGTILDFLDIGSVEILKGPQGTLYGRNATGGAILINTANPTHEFQTTGLLEYGRFDTLKLQTVVNAPVSDTLAIRIAGQYADGGAYMRNVTTGRKIRGRETYTLRGKIKWDPNPDFSAILALEYGKIRIVDAAAGHTAVGAPLCLPCRSGIYTATDSPYEVTENTRLIDLSRSYSANLRLTYDAGPVKLQSITAYRDISANVHNHVDKSPVAIFVDRSVNAAKTYTQDFQLSSDLGGAFDFLASAQYSHDDSINLSERYGSQFNVPVTAAVYPRSLASIVTDSYALVAEAYVRPIEHLTVTLGGRYSRDKREMSVVLNPLARTIFSPTGPDQFVQKVAYSKFTPRAVIAYDAGAVNLYASYTQGFKSGGFKTPIFAPQRVPVRPETIDSYEIGAKFVSPDRRLHMNLAAFYYDYKDVQVQAFFGLSGVSTFVNAASARGKGVEYDATFRPNDWLSLGVGGSYLDAKFRHFPGAVINTIVRNAAGAPVSLGTGTADLSGTRLMRAPKWSGYATADLKIPVGNDWTSRLSGVFRYSSSYLFAFDAGGDPGTDRQKAYGLIDLSGGVGPNSGAYEIGFYINNLTDKLYYDNIATNGFGIFEFPAPPRTYGLRLKVKLS